MKCVVYKGARKSDAYLFVKCDSDISRVPSDLLKALGTLEKVMNLELSPDQTLARTDPDTVRQQIHDNGFYLQLPPAESESPL
ncbi:MAG: YcgL domain-containing protein [Pseudomonadota bacterium]|jgi:hypothetical protein|nr:YcgL domain-containing protein [Pseudomonadota bacterium]MEE3291691.1 YcgL domain-containing protein [Pseudomonadota bacterium]